jgi:hypothetical protein
VHGQLPHRFALVDENLVHSLVRSGSAPGVDDEEVGQHVKARCAVIQSEVPVYRVVAVGGAGHERRSPLNDRMWLESP